MTEHTQLPRWRVWAIRTVARIRRSYNLTRGTARIMQWLYDDPVRHQHPITARIRYDRLFEVPVNTVSWIEWNLFFNGCYEPHITEALRRLLAPGDTAIDIGANIGVHTLVMSRVVGYRGRVVAIEPHPAVRRKLEQTLIANHITNVDVIPVALSDSAGRTVLFEGEGFAENEGTASLWNVASEEVKGIEVAVDTLTNVVVQTSCSNVQLIKMDVQGAELRILVGGTEVLARYKPYLIFEYDPHAWRLAGASFHEAATLLRDLNY